MIKNRLFINLVLMLSVAATYANTTANTLVGTMKISNDSLRIAELDTFWAEVSRTVREGDFEGYKATYHEDAVVVFTTRENKSSISITKALSNWKQDFIDTKAGKTKNTVEFRFSQRVGDENTAHETGIFGFQSNDDSGKTAPKQFVHFEALLVKKDNGWLMVMEY
ncbi:MULTISPECIES: nuclear transport factor 2 family protein [Maribacter]|uniref:Nuclear transport factor 2 family protein n=1 Tax=Maribacter flavus TaxID=1658664 RepID=A0ABU7IIU2_9FLAO|nr:MULTISPECIES: nuclear transport factor 2 family protein [Maribacter]MDC6405870.1 nuclear transport factor 2 family protein [Maribacter sp. PR66]MEE1972878.1 nuclear transport factor 2 family protein [Maribacter flavus]